MAPRHARGQAAEIVVSDFLGIAQSTAQGNCSWRALTSGEVMADIARLIDAQHLAMARALRTGRSLAAMGFPGGTLG